MRNMLIIAVSLISFLTAAGYYFYNQNKGSEVYIKLYNGEVETNQVSKNKEKKLLKTVALNTPYFSGLGGWMEAFYPIQKNALINEEDFYTRDQLKNADPHVLLNFAQLETKKMSELNFPESSLFASVYISQKVNKAGTFYIDGGVFNK